MSGAGSGRASGTDSVPALVRFGNGLRGTGGRALKDCSGLGLDKGTLGGEVRETWESWDAGGCGDGGIYTSVAGGAEGIDIGTESANSSSSWTESSRSPNSCFHASKPPMSSTGTRLRILRNAVSYIARMRLEMGASGGPGVWEASS
jgi:hypothetical protein